MKTLAQLGVLLLLPDLMVSGRWSQLWQRLAPLRPSIVAVTAVHLTPDRFAALYSDSAVKQHNRGRPASVLGYQLGQLDMSIPVVVRTPYPVQLTALLDAWKGPSSYALRQPGDLRNVWPPANRCMSLFHSPDNLDLLVRDLGILFGPRVSADITKGHLRDTIPAEVVNWLRMHLSIADETHPYDVVLRNILRGLALLGYGAHTESSDLAASCRSIIPEILAVRDELVLLPPARLPRDLEKWLANIHARLPALGLPLMALPNSRHDEHLLHIARYELLAALHILSSPERWTETEAHNVVSVFQHNALYLDPWERHRLTTALTFWSS